MNKSRKKAIINKEIRKLSSDVQIKKTKKEKIKEISISMKILQLIMLAILEIVFYATNIGYFALNDNSLLMTTTHLPVVIATLYLGNVYGLYIAVIQTICNFIYIGNWSILSIYILPNLLLPFVVFNLNKKFKFKKIVNGGLSAFLGSLLRSVVIILSLILMGLLNFVPNYLIVVFSEAFMALIIGMLSFSKIGDTPESKKKWWQLWKKRKK